MQCPKCRTEVLDFHFYCPVCRTPLQNYPLDPAEPRKWVFDRVLSQVINLLILAFLIGGSVLIARSIDWKELINGFKKASQPADGGQKGRRSRTGASSRRPSAGATDADQSNEPIKQPVAARESVKSMPHRIEELPSLDDPSDNPNLAAQDGSLEGAASTAFQGFKPGVSLGIEQVESNQYGNSGLVTINSYAPARIYVNGQFSGLTPRTIKLVEGEHQIRLIADGYDEWLRSVRLKSRQQIGIMASMRKAQGR